MAAQTIVINPLTIVAALLVLEFIAPFLDGLTGSGWGLGIASFLLVACTMLTAAYSTYAVQWNQRQQTVAHGLGGAMLLGVFLILALVITGVCTLVLLIGAGILASIDGHWRWLTAIVAAALVPTLVIALPIIYGNMTTGATSGGSDALSILFQPALTAVFTIPQLAVFAYCVSRIVRSIRRARARRPARV